MKKPIAFFGNDVSDEEVADAINAILETLREEEDTLGGLEVLWWNAVGAPVAVLQARTLDDGTYDPVRFSWCSP